jgi:hypothetical protein
LADQPPIPGRERDLAFFDHVLKEGGRHFDVFDLRLYSDPYTIPDRVATLRKMMADLGCPKPIVCTEYHGPGFLDFKENRQYAGLMAEWSAALAAGKGPPGRGDKDTDPIAALYAARDTLAPQTQRFLAGGPRPLEEKFARLQCRDLVMRNVLALSAGVQKTLFWDVWHDPGQRDPTHLLFGRHQLLDYEDGVLTKRLPAAEALQRAVAALDGVEQVRRVGVADRPALYLFEVHRRGR